MRRIEVRSEVALLPVLEVEPWNYSTRPLPKAAGSRAHPVPWSAYFRNCMEDAGFTGAVPISEGSHFVSARSLIASPILERLVRESVHDTEQISKLSGGLALIADGTAVIEPSCCGDLTNREEWIRILTARTPSGVIWIGHPHLGFRIDRGRVTLTEQWESKSAPAPAYLVEVSLQLAQLGAALERAYVELESFRAELVPVVTRVLRSPRLVKRVIDALT